MLPGQFIQLVKLVPLPWEPSTQEELGVRGQAGDQREQGRPGS